MAAGMSGCAGGVRGHHGPASAREVKVQAGKPPSVWIDDRHAIVRRGMAACLQQAGFVVRGESGGLAPVPPVTGLDVLVFEAEGAALRRAVRLTSGEPV